MKQYKYLVVAGCSQTYGQGCKEHETYGYMLAEKLGLKLINLAVCGTGWYAIETSITSFIHNNKNIINECFFILQKSALDRRVNYEEIAIAKSDVWERWNIKYLSKINVCSLGYIKWDKYQKFGQRPHWWKGENYRPSGMWSLPHELDINLHYFPEHKHYPNSRHQWKLNENNDLYPPFIHEQFQELMLHWGLRINSFHLFLKSVGADHIIVDGYSPFLSYKLNFTNYYDTDEEYDMVKEFWSTGIMGLKDDVDDVMIYDFKNIEVGWVFDSIDIKNKIDDVVLWSLYQFKTHNTDWNIDGGHAGPLGMKLIADVLYKNLVSKGWVEEIL